MTFENLKDIIREILNEARIYGASGENPHSISTEYELTPEEILSLKGMTEKQRKSFIQMKLYKARKDKKICIMCGQKPVVQRSDGTVGTHCNDCLEKIKSDRKARALRRGSCTRCPNPPLPGKKLCQRCTDELELKRIDALEKGLCLRCKKEPSDINAKSRRTLFCRNCNQIKRETERQRKLYTQLQNPSQ